MACAWRNFKIIFSRPLFIIIFRPKILFFVTYSILTGQTKVEFVIYWVLTTHCNESTVSYFQRCIGLRFLYPVYCIPEVELTKSSDTSITTVDKCKNFNLLTYYSYENNVHINLKTRFEFDRKMWENSIF